MSVKTVAKIRIDSEKYGRLLARTQPAVITTEQENERMLQEIERLMDKGEDKLSPEEVRLLDLMGKLVEDYEATAYPMPGLPPNRFLGYLIESKGLKQADLVPIFKTSGRVSDVVNGKRQISKTQAKELGLFFKLDPGVFI